MSALDRRAVVAELVAGAPDALVVSGLGSASYDLYAAGDRDENFYLWARWAPPCPSGSGSRSRSRTARSSS
jgi:hypothetical protein